MFTDRQVAGRLLAQHVLKLHPQSPIVLALPRGGVPVAYEIAHALKAPLDVLVVRKIGTPWNPELGIGAIAPGIKIINDDLVRRLGVSQAEIDRITEAEQMEMERRIQRYRGGTRFPDVQNKTVILVDDGLATGITAKAAIAAIRQFHPKKLILAVPVGAPDTIDMLKSSVDELLCLETPPDFGAVGYWYRHFHPVADEEVLDYLNRTARK